MTDTFDLAGEYLPTVEVWQEDAAGWQWVGELPGCETLNWTPTDLGDGDWSLRIDPDAPGGDLFTADRLTTIDWRGYLSTWQNVPHPQADDTTKREVLEVTGPGAWARLGWDVAWPDPTRDINDQPVLTESDSPTYKGPAETVIKAIVRDNLVNRRGMNLTIPASQGRGATVTARAQFQKVSDLVVALAKLGGVTATLGLARRGPDSTRADLVFDVFPRPDLTDEVWLTSDAHTIDDWDLVETEPTITLAIVSGAGTGGVDRVRRIVATPESEAAAAKWGGHRVGYVDGPDSFDPEELDQAGRQALLDGASTRTLTMTAADTEGQMAFRDYLPGAIVTAAPEGEPEVEEIITAIEVSMSASDGVTASPTIGDPSAAGDAVSDLSDTVTVLAQKVDQQQRRR